VLRPGAAVLVRNFFPGRTQRVGLLRFFPEVRRVFYTFPTVEQTTAAFATAGFSLQATESVPQQTAPSLAAIAKKLDRKSDTALQSLSDAEFAAGMTRLRAAATRGQDPRRRLPGAAGPTVIAAADCPVWTAACARPTGVQQGQTRSWLWQPRCG